MKQHQWVNSRLRSMARGQSARMQRMGNPTVPESVQIRRFLLGQERWRLEQGLVTPQQWADYQMEMLKKLGV